MKKLKLKALELGAVEVLSREQLKSVFGGETPSGSSNCYVRCNQDSSAGSYVGDCNRSTVDSVCNSDLSNAVCVCS
jgi:natural product precursor